MIVLDLRVAVPESIVNCLARIGSFSHWFVSFAVNDHWGGTFSSIVIVQKVFTPLAEIGVLRAQAVSCAHVGGGCVSHGVVNVINFVLDFFEVVVLNCAFVTKLIQHFGSQG